MDWLALLAAAAFVLIAYWVVLGLLALAFRYVVRRRPSGRRDRRRD